MEGVTTGERRVTRRRRPTVAEREARFAGRTPGEALTLEEWEALGYGNDGHRTRTLTDAPIGTHPHTLPTTEAPTT